MTRSRQLVAALALAALGSFGWSPATAQSEDSGSQAIPWDKSASQALAAIADHRAEALANSPLTPAAATPGTAFAGFTPLTPQRVLDTRNGIGAAKGPVGPQQSIDVLIAGQGGVPADAAAVVLNVTVTEPTLGGFITVWPTGVAKPTASSLNMVAGQTVPNLVVAKLGNGGKVSFYNDTGSSHLLADVTAFTRSDGHYIGLTPSRILDTRHAIGRAGAVAAHQTFDLNVLNVGGVPASGVSAIAVNVTVTNPTAVSFVTVWPSGVAQPNASSLNMIADQTVPNLVVIPVGANGKLSFYNDAGTTDLIGDVVGWMPTGSAYVPRTPNRVMDTRSGIGNYGTVAPAAPNGPYPKTVGPLGPGSVYELDLRSLYPGTIKGYSAVSAYVLNVTASAPTSGGFVTVYPSKTSLPNTSNLNLEPNKNTPNLVVAKPGVDGLIYLYNFAGSVDLIVDLVGVVPIQNALDTPDQDGSPKFHVVYMRAAESAASDPSPVVAAIRNDVAALDGWFFNESDLGAGGHRRMNVDQAAAQVEVTVWNTGFTHAQLAAFLVDDATSYAIVDKLYSDGFGWSDTRRWLIYIDADVRNQHTFCGVTVFQWTTLFVQNDCASLQGTVTASQVGVAPNSAAVALHEMLHGLGAVPSCAPNFDYSDPNYQSGEQIGHSKIVNDLMYWNASPSVPLSYPKHMDALRQDYFGHTNGGCLDVSKSIFVHQASS